MKHMNEMYDNGYFKACLDIYHLIENTNDFTPRVRSVKKYNAMIKGVLKEILQNSLSRETFKNWGGDSLIYVSEDGKTVRIMDQNRHI